MNEQLPLVQPNDNAPTPPPEVAPTDPTAAAPAGDSTSLPDDMLAIPAFQGLLAGAPPAISASIADFTNRPEGKLIQEHKDDLLKAGIGLYRSLQGDLGVLFNQMYISGEDLKTADKGGTLDQVAIPFDQANQQLAASGADHPLLNPGAAPTGPKTPGAPSLLPSVGSTPTPAPSPMAPQMPPTPAKQIGAKMRNLALGSPTSGPKPGEGRLLNQILKPVI